MPRTIAAVLSAAALLSLLSSPAHACYSEPATIGFAPGSAQLPSGDRRGLEEQAFLVEALGPGARIRITAYADRVGDGWGNLRLSRLRAEAVRRELVRLGVPASRIDILNRGEAGLPIPTPDDRPEARNRIVIAATYAEAQLKRDNPVSGCAGYSAGL